MKDRILDLIDDIKYFLEDHWKEVGVGLILIGLFLGLFLVNKNNSNEDTTKNNGISIEEKQKVVQGMFTYLNEANIGTEDSVVLDYDILVKKPVVEPEEFETALQYLIDLMKYKYNTDKSKFKGLKVNFYDRIIQYDEGVPPVGEMYYMLKKNVAMEKELGKDWDKQEITVQPKDIQWMQTTMMDNKEIGDYENYTIYNTFLIYDYSEVKPLTTEEYQFYLKLNKYYVFTNDWYDAIKKYLSWERGIAEDITYNQRVIDAYQSVIKRVEDVGAPESVYPSYDNSVVAEMLIKNPSWVNFMNEGGFIKDDAEALKNVILIKPEYIDILVGYKLNKEEEENAKKELIKSISKLQDKSMTEEEKNKQLTKSLGKMRDEIEKSEDDSSLQKAKEDEIKKLKESGKNNKDKKDIKNKKK